MPLLSSMFRNDHRLQSCLTADASHLVPGSVGPHVARVQTALFVVDGLRVSRDDERNQQYGASTAAASSEVVYELFAGERRGVVT